MKNVFSFNKLVLFFMLINFANSSFAMGYRNVKINKILTKTNIDFVKNNSGLFFNLFREGGNFNRAKNLCFLGVNLIKSSNFGFVDAPKVKPNFNMPNFLNIFAQNNNKLNKPVIINSNLKSFQAIASKQPAFSKNNFESNFSNSISLVEATNSKNNNNSHSNNTGSSKADNLEINIPGAYFLTDSQDGDNDDRKVDNSQARSIIEPNKENKVVFLDNSKLSINCDTNFYVLPVRNEKNSHSVNINNPETKSEDIACKADSILSDLEINNVVYYDYPEVPNHDLNNINNNINNNSNILVFPAVPSHDLSSKNNLVFPVVPNHDLNNINNNSNIPAFPVVPSHDLNNNNNNDISAFPDVPTHDLNNNNNNNMPAFPAVPTHDLSSNEKISFWQNAISGFKKLDNKNKAVISGLVLVGAATSSYAVNSIYNKYWYANFLRNKSSVDVLSYLMFSFTDKQRYQIESFVTIFSQALTRRESIIVLKNKYYKLLTRHQLVLIDSIITKHKQELDTQRIGTLEISKKK